MYRGRIKELCLFSKTLKQFIRELAREGKASADLSPKDTECWRIWSLWKKDILPNQWHPYYYKHPGLIWPCHIRIIEAVEHYFTECQNEKYEELQSQKENRPGGSRYKKGDYVPRKQGEKWTDDEGRTWQTIWP